MSVQDHTGVEEAPGIPRKLWVLTSVFLRKLLHYQNPSKHFGWVSFV